MSLNRHRHNIMTINTGHFVVCIKNIHYSFNNQKTWPEPGAVLPEPGAVSMAVLSEFIAEREFGEAVSSSL